MFTEDSFVHKGLKLFWLSEGADCSGIQPHFAKVLKTELVHLSTAKTLSDIAAGLGRIKGFEKLTGHSDRYALHVNGPYCVTFTCSGPKSGFVTKIDLENYHGAGGAKKR